MNNEEKILKLLENMQSQISENTQILKALEHKIDTIKAEQENMKHELAHISGDTKSIKSDIEIMSNDLNFIEVATGKNITDMANLKSVK